MGKNFKIPYLNNLSKSTLCTSIFRASLLFPYHEKFRLICIICHFGGKYSTNSEIFKKIWPYGDIWKEISMIIFRLVGSKEVRNTSAFKKIYRCCQQSSNHYPSKLTLITNSYLISYCNVACLPPCCPFGALCGKMRTWWFRDVYVLKELMMC